MKTCTKCLVMQGIEQFPTHKNYKDGHTTWCRDCLSKQSTEWQKNNKERRNEIGRKSYRKNPELRQESKFKNRYGITMKQYLAMSSAQNDCCAICKKHKSENKNEKLFVDHCHKTNKVRGLLCDGCNKAIGTLGDDVDRLKSAIAYLSNNAP